MADRLLYATPTGKHPHPGYVVSMRDLEMSCATFERHPNDFQMASGPVQMARTTIAERALAGAPCTERHDHQAKKGNDCKLAPYDYLLMHDDDLIVNAAGPVGNPIDAWHAIFEKNQDVGVIGAVYLREAMETPTVVMSHPDYPEENCHVIAGLPPAPFPVAGIGTGFMMIRVSALRELVEKEDGAHAIFRFPFNRTRWGTVNHVGEDYDFCARMRGAGYKVLADGRFETMHIKETGQLIYSPDTYNARWQDGSPGVRERAEKLRRAVPSLMTAIRINGVDCIDHVPAVKFDAEQASMRRAERAAKKKEAA
jgi:hypothetical protein